MKQLFKIAAFVGVMLMVVSCYDDSKIWNKLDDHEARISSLEKICKDLNTNVTALQGLVDAVQNKDYVTSVTPITSGGENVGYTINFSKGEPITIYHGEKGEKGDKGDKGDSIKGADGHTPIIGVHLDADGVWYWTLDGDWLLDQGGDKVKANGVDGMPGKDGEPGQEGENGAKGDSGVTPHLKIENEFWYVSYDNDSTWVKLGKAVSESGTSSDAMFEKIDDSNNEFVIFKLADGSEIKLPTWYAFNELQKVVMLANGNISGLQTLVTNLQNNVFVTSVTPIEEDGLKGWTICFSDNTTATIYNGKDGENGAPGKDGTNGTPGQDGENGRTPSISVAQDTDNQWYWTIDGEWLLNENGEKVKAVGEDGKNGTPGQDGAPGKDGSEPTFEIRKDETTGIDHLWCSTNNGDTWNDCGPVTGDSIFQGVNVDTNGNWVVITLADGQTTIKFPTWSAFDNLQQQVSTINTNVSGLQRALTALQNNVYVSSVTPTSDGYIISFSDGTSAELKNGKDGSNGSNGEDGHSPIISVAQDTDGKWYWKIDGEWLLDNQKNKVKAVGEDGSQGRPGADGSDGERGPQGNPGQDGKDGITPVFKIENGKWYISYDNRASWTELGQATGNPGQNGTPGQQGAQGIPGQQGAQGPKGDPGDSFLKSITDGTDAVTIVLNDTDETTIVIPKKPVKKITISNISGNAIKLAAGETVTVKYQISGASSNVVVSASSDGNYIVKSSSKKVSGDVINCELTVIAPDPLVDGFVNILAMDTDGIFAMAVVNFNAGNVEAPTLYIKEGENNVKANVNGENEIVLTYWTNFTEGTCSAMVEVGSDWIHIIPATKAEHSENIKVQVDANTGAARSGKVTVSNGSYNASFIISQDGKAVAQKNSFRKYMSDNYGEEWESDSKVLALTELNVNKPIDDFGGIEKLTKLTSFTCRYAYAETIDLSKNTALQTLNLPNATFESIDLSKNTALNTLNMSNSAVKSIDLSKNTALNTVDLSGTLALSTLIFPDRTGQTGSILTGGKKDVNETLTTVNVTGSSLTNIDFSKNIQYNGLNTIVASNSAVESISFATTTSLKTLNCNNTKVANLNLSNASSLEHLECYNCSNLSSITVNKPTLGNNGNFKYLDCHNCAITALTNTNKCEGLEYLDGSNNNITSLDLETPTGAGLLGLAQGKLKTLNCSNNPNLTTLKLSNGSIAGSVTGKPVLESLNCSNCAISGDLKLNYFDNLTYINCSNNNFSTLNISNSPSINYLDCSHNKLTSINMQGLLDQAAEAAGDSGILDWIGGLGGDSNSGLGDLIGGLSGQITLSPIAIEELNCSYNALEVLDITSLTSIKKVSCTNQVNDGEFYQQNGTSLQYIYVTYLQKISIKEGFLSIGTITIDKDKNTQYSTATNAE